MEEKKGFWDWYFGVDLKHTISCLPYFIAVLIFLMLASNGAYNFVSLVAGNQLYAHILAFLIATEMLVSLYIAEKKDFDGFIDVCFVLALVGAFFPVLFPIVFLIFSGSLAGNIIYSIKNKPRKYDYHRRHKC